MHSLSFLTISADGEGMMLAMITAVAAATTMIDLTGTRDTAATVRSSSAVSGNYRYLSFSLREKLRPRSFSITAMPASNAIASFSLVLAEKKS